LLWRGAYNTTVIRIAKYPYHVLRQNSIRPVFSITSSGRPPLVAMIQPFDFGDLVYGLRSGAFLVPIESA
jgi:hypothetical protein